MPGQTTKRKAEIQHYVIHEYYADRASGHCELHTGVAWALKNIFREFWKSPTELRAEVFRRKVLESDYSARAAIDILQQVSDGSLPFDRTMKMSTAENLIRSVVKTRLPENIRTANKLLDKNRKLFAQYLGAQDEVEKKKAAKQLKRNRIKIASLLEELSLRTSRIQPMMKKLEGILSKSFHKNTKAEQGIYFCRSRLKIS